MNLLMVTNTFSPYVGGLVRSVEIFTEEFRRRGHRVLVIAPSFPGTWKSDGSVIRIPSIRRFNGSDFSYGLPIPAFVFPAIDEFRPDIVHSHHPFLLGDMALRISASRDAPLVFTHHTMYETLARYVLGESPAVTRFVIDLSTGYANLCDQVIAPSASTERILRERGVRTPIEVIPTGVDLERFRSGDREGFRASMGIPPGTFVVGHVGRLVPEKNIGFLVQAVTGFLSSNGNARFLVVGTGPSEGEIRERFERLGMSGRLHFAGVLRGEKLSDAYHAMDVFAFASRNETQGMVLTEAMAAGVPVVAMDAAGIREAVVDGWNGFLLPSMNASDFSEVLSRVATSSPDDLCSMGNAARVTAERYTIQRCAGEVLRLYGSLLANRRLLKGADGKPPGIARRLFGQEKNLWMNRAHAAAAAFSTHGRPGAVDGHAH